MSDVTITVDNPNAISRQRVCSLCGASLASYRPQARFCSNACKVEAGRIRAILSPSNPEPYSSVAERLKAAQKPSKASQTASEIDRQDPTEASDAKSAIAKLISHVKATTANQESDPVIQP